MSEVVSFKTALEICHKDLQALKSSFFGPASEDHSIAGLVIDSKNHARDLLGAVYEVTARLREKENVPAANIESLEKHVRSYYDYSDPFRFITRQELQSLEYHLEETTKLFLSMKPYLTVLATERRDIATVPTSRKVFIIHGRSEENKNALKDMLIGYGFEPVILSEQPNRGRHLLEKLLVHTSDVGYVFVLMTPDDVAATREDFGDLVLTDFRDKTEFMRRVGEIFKPRVRQNVMFEYGLCIGSLGKENVCVLVESEGLEIPSDVLGYGHIPFEKNVSECEQRIKSELEAAGYKIPV